MAKYKFKTNLSTNGIENLKRELMRYKNDTLKRKTDFIVQRLLDIGADKANVQISESPLGKFVKVSVKLDSNSDVSRGYLISTGEIFESEGYEPFNVMLAVEFGAGKYANNGEMQPNPKGAEFGYGINTYNPDSDHAVDPEGWWFFNEKTGKWNHSFGIEATMPMYQADQEILKMYKKVVREAIQMR